MDVWVCLCHFMYNLRAGDMRRALYTAASAGRATVTNDQTFTPSTSPNEQGVHIKRANKNE